MAKEYRAVINGKIIANRVWSAKHFFARLAGLLVKPPLGECEGLLICPCSQIHTMGMKYSVDALFLDKSGEIVHIEADMHPGLVSRYIFDSHQVLELRAGAVFGKGIKIGSKIRFEIV